MNPASPNLNGQLDILAGQLANLLRNLDPSARSAILAAFPSRVSDLLALGETELTSELRTWALAQFTEEEIVAGLREVRATGGLQFRDLLEELEKELPHGRAG
jgi:hypothetical protein